MEKDISTEEKIKEAAKKVFQEKGFGLTRTRDIAEEAGINLALLNYYFRSKDKLFEIVMQESMREMLSYIIHIVSDKETTLSEKIDAGVARYIDGLSKNPNLPMFVFRELQANPQQLFDKVGIPVNLVEGSHMFQQIQEQIDKKKLDFTPIHFFINLVSLSVFPIVARPFLEKIYTMDKEGLNGFIGERKKLVPMWLKTMLQIEE